MDAYINEFNKLKNVCTDELNRLKDAFDEYCQSRKLSYLYLVLVTVVLNSIVLYIYFNVYLNLNDGLFASLKKWFYAKLRLIPFVRNRINKELNNIKSSLVEDIKKSNKNIDYIQALPKKGIDKSKIMDKIEQYKKMGERKWKDGACSGCVYGANEILEDLNVSVYKKFIWTNVLHADIWPDVRKMESEVVRMVLTMYNGDEKSCGTMSSGGTESIMLACKAYRDLASSRGIKRPEMIVPESAHAAFHKASQYFNIKLNMIKVDEKTKKVNLKLMRNAINSHTCMLVASAPNFSYGVMDPIPEISELGVKYNIPVHVDACLGGFLIPFMHDKNLPLFDFRLPGVTSISCDTHKYGYTEKGSSVIMYRNEEYRKYQYFSLPDWQGGIYASPTFAGSRGGSIIAMTWATMLYFGQDGYVKSTKEVIDKTEYIHTELKKIKELEIMGEPDVSVVAFTSKKFNIFNLLDALKKDWDLNAIQNPSGLHVAVTKMHLKDGVADRLITDIRKAVKDIMNSPNRQMGKVAQIYCSSQSVSDRTILEDASYLYLNACYDTNI